MRILLALLSMLVLLSVLVIASEFDSGRMLHVRSHNPSDGGKLRKREYLRKRELRDAYGPMPDNYAPSYDPSYPDPCAYDENGWLSAANQDGCPIKIKPQTDGIGVPDGGASNKSSGIDNMRKIVDDNIGNSGINNLGIDGYKHPAHFDDDDTEDEIEDMDRDVSDPVFEKLNRLPKNKDRIKDDIVPSDIGKDKKASDKDKKPDGKDKGPGGKDKQSDGKDDKKPAEKDRQGSTVCKLDDDDELVDIDVLNCASLCILSHNCPPVQQSCSIAAEDGTVIDVTAINCSAINLLSSEGV